MFLRRRGQLVSANAGGPGKRRPREVGRLGHRLKGTIVYLGAKPAEEAAGAWSDAAGRAGATVPEAEEAVLTLEKQCGVLKAALAELAAEAEQGE